MQNRYVKIYTLLCYASIHNKSIIVCCLNLNRKCFGNYHKFLTVHFCIHLLMELNVLSDWQIRREREIQQQMMLQDEETLEMIETFSSLQQEVELKTKKLKRVR